MLIIENDDQNIISTNYYESEFNKYNKFFVSLNAGAFRLLIPERYSNEIQQELKLAQSIKITWKIIPYMREHEGFEILFDDTSDDPYLLQLSKNSFDRLPAEEDINKWFIFSAWIKNNNNIKKIYEQKCFYTCNI